MPDDIHTLPVLTTLTPCWKNYCHKGFNSMIIKDSILETTFRGQNEFFLLNHTTLPLTLIYPAHLEDVPCQSGVNHIFEG